MNRRDYNPLYTLRWDDAAGEHTVTGTSRDIHLNAASINRKGDAGEAWDIAVHDRWGVDITGRFFNHLDQDQP